MSLSSLCFSYIDENNFVPHSNNFLTKQYERLPSKSASPMQNKPPPAAIKALPGASKCRNAFTSRGKPEVMIAKAETTSANNKLNAMMNTVNKMIATTNTNRKGKRQSTQSNEHNPKITECTYFSFLYLFLLLE